MILSIGTTYAILEDYDVLQSHYLSSTQIEEIIEQVHRKTDVNGLPVPDPGILGPAQLLRNA